MQRYTPMINKESTMLGIYHYYAEHPSSKTNKQIAGCFTKQIPTTFEEASDLTDYVRNFASTIFNCEPSQVVIKSLTKIN